MLRSQIPHILDRKKKTASPTVGMMKRVHPNASAPSSPSCAAAGAAAAAAPLTVWRKSLLLNCNGFTVFDAKGNLVFRVDNYTSGTPGQILLMDSAGAPLLTIRRKKLSLGEQWMIFEREESVNPRYLVRRNMNLIPIGNRALAHVEACGGGGGGEVYAVEGSYSRRSCAVYDGRRRRVAEIRRKEAAAGGVAFGLDVFRLVVEPGFDATVAMAVVILLEQMFGSRGSLMR